jgi:hypothetical protein
MQWQGQIWTDLLQNISYLLDEQLALSSNPYDFDKICPNLTKEKPILSFRDAFDSTMKLIKPQKAPNKIFNNMLE